MYRWFRRSRLPLDLIVVRRARNVVHKGVKKAILYFHYDQLSLFTDTRYNCNELRPTSIMEPEKSMEHPISGSDFDFRF